MSRRPLAALASVVLAMLGLVFLFPPDCAYACSCMGVPIQRYISSSEAVFSGRVTAIEKDAGTATATLRVTEVWKGPERGTLEVSTSSQESACGFPFEEGREYLLYAYGKRGLKTDICNGTKPLEKAGADLKALGDGERPQDGEVLSDTSGGVSGRALAGLALAASVLVVVRLVRSG